MYLLAIDPGVETGVALLGEDGSIIWTVTAEGPDYPELTSALGHYPDARLAMEDSPDTRHHQETFVRVKTLVEADGRPVAYVRPSQWKNHPAARVPEDLESKHEREAVGIGRWHLSQLRSSDADQARSADAPAAHQ